MIEEDLFSHLSTNVTLVNERVYPLIMPQDCVKPALVYSLVSEIDEQAINSVEAYGVRHRFQIDVYGKSYSQVKAIKNQVKEALYNFDYYPHNMRVTEGSESDIELFRQTLDFNIQG